MSEEAAPMKLVPQSEYRSDTYKTSLEMNLVRAAMKGSVVKSVTTSKCTAFVAKQMNRQRSVSYTHLDVYKRQVCTYTLW